MMSSHHITSASSSWKKESTMSKLEASDGMRGSISRLNECVASGSLALSDLFELLCDDDGYIKKSDFLYRISDSGLRWNDPRLENAIKELLPPQTFSLRNRMAGADVSMLIDTSGSLDIDSFRKIVVHNLDLIERAVKHDFVIPDFKDFSARLENIFNACRNNNDGNVATYIPQLAKVNPDYWAMSVCTVDGQRCSFGDADVPFCLQSCVKPLSYTLALQELGPDTVHRYVGQEPSGQHFNAVSLDENNRPHNPMVNAGAIVICSLLKPELSLPERFDYVSKFLKRLSGGEFVGFNNSVFLSERESADRNFALAYYMREHKCFPDGTNLMETLDFYFQQCSAEVNSDSASVMAATLANGGVCPISGETIFDPTCVCHTLSLMLSCGMYDYSGQFAFKIGLPAKSGVSGAILLVIPNIAGICVYSPKLDYLGNSCRGIMFSELLLKEFNFHQLDSMRRMKYKRDPRQRRSEKPVNSVLNLIYSAAVGDIMSVTRHALNGCDMNASDYDGRTALHLAATEGHIDIVKYLLTKCHVIRLPRDRWGNTPLSEAQRCGQNDIANLILEAAILAGEMAPPESILDTPTNTESVDDQPTAEKDEVVEKNNNGTAKESSPSGSVEGEPLAEVRKASLVDGGEGGNNSPDGNKVPPSRPPPPVRSPSEAGTPTTNPATNPLFSK